MKKSLLLFDMDGTLITLKEVPDYHGVSTGYAPYVSLRQEMKAIAASHGVPMEVYEGLSRMAHIWNRTREYAETRGFTESETWKLMDAINKPFTRHEAVDHERSYLIPGTNEALDALLNAGHVLGVVTTASRGAYERLSSSPEFGSFGKHFRHSITRDECSYIKPHPEPIARALRLFDRSDFYYIGDSDHDSQAAQAAGGFFILINTRRYDEKTIMSLNPHAVINNLGDLPDILTR
jgi:HAD superfamily hydrolase (TIGR01549 family)